MNNPNPIIPWNAKEFFSDPGKYELVHRSGKSLSATDAQVFLDGTLAAPWLWEGMREVVPQPRYIYINVYALGTSTWGSQEMADRHDAGRKWCQKVELIPPDSSKQASPGSVEGLHGRYQP